MNVRVIEATGAPPVRVMIARPTRTVPSPAAPEKRTSHAETFLTCTMPPFAAARARMLGSGWPAALRKQLRQVLRRTLSTRSRGCLGSNHVSVCDVAPERAVRNFQAAGRRSD